MTACINNLAGADFFSAKWTGRVKAPISSVFTFTVTGDDGVRLFVNGAKVIDGCRDQGPTVLTARSWTPGHFPTSSCTNYYEYEGGAACRLQWSYPGQALEAIPQSHLFP